MSSLGGIQQGGEPVPQRGDGLGRLIHRQRRLRQPDHLGRIADVHRTGASRAVHQPDARGRLPGGADDLFVTLVPDEQDVVILRREAPGLIVHLGDERARRVDHPKAPLLRRLPDVGGDPVRREHHHRAGRYVRILVNEHRAALFQRSHHMHVVHDLLADINGGAVALDRHLDGLHSPVDTGAVAARLCQEDTPGGHRHVIHVRRAQAARTRSDGPDRARRARRPVAGP